MATKKRTRRPSKRRAHKIHTGGMPTSHVAHAKHSKKRRARKGRKKTAKKAHSKRSAKGAKSVKSRYFTSKSGRTWCLAPC